MYEAGGTLRASALDLAPMVSYAGNQEDVRLRRVVGLLSSTTYVDVGAGHPIEGSVTYWLYTQGWRGVLVEPGARRELLADARPGDVVVEALVGSGSGEVVLYETSPDAGMSTMRADRLEEVRALGQSVRELRMPVLSLTEVFERAPGPVSVLSVDVEGAEGEVLASLDWERHRPTVVVVEAILPWQAVTTRADFEHHLLDAGYVDVAFDGVNAYYVDRQAAHVDELRAALAYPVSLLDRWEPYDTVRTREAAARAAAESAVAHEAAEAERQQAHQLRRRLAEQQDRGAELERQLAHLDAELGRQLAHLDAELERSGRRVDELTTQLDEILGSTTWRYGMPVMKALKGRAGHLRTLAQPAVAVGAARRRALGHVESARLRRAGPEGRAALAVTRHTHPAFLRLPEEPRHGPPGASSWQDLAASFAEDDDTGLRARLERREGVRDPLRRSVLLAALAEGIGERGSKSPGRWAKDRRCVLVDARALQEPGLSTRGVGQYARELVRALSGTGRSLVMFVDASLPPLDGPGAAFEQVTAVSDELVGRTRWLVQPSPMTADQWPLAALLDDASVWCTAVAYDFIPSRFPAVYLPDRDGLLRQAARQHALRLYDELLPISHATSAEVVALLGSPGECSVVWPALQHDAAAVSLPPAPLQLPERYVLVAAGHEHRKNLVGGLGAAALLRLAVGEDVGVVVMGWSGPVELVHTWAADAGLPSDGVHVLPYVDDDQATAVRRGAEVAVVPSFAEGLSLPVIECVRDGCPVVASDIPPHLELLGPGPWLADPVRPADLARAAAQVLNDRQAVLARQQEAVAGHDHVSVEQAVMERHRQLSDDSADRPVRSASPPGTRPRLGVVTPWPPQRTGIADYSRSTLAPLAQAVDLTLYTSASAESTGVPDASFRRASVTDPALAGHDALLTVLGNSHFHLPGLEVIEARGGVALCHDVRLTELNSYLGLQDPAGSGRAGLSAAADRRTLRHELDAAPSLGFAHVAQHCSVLLFHSAAAAERVAAETGARTAALPFVPYREPTDAERTPEARRQAREDLGLSGGDVHLGLLGGVDVRTKAADVILEAHAWLRQWGHPVVLHVVGGVDPVLQGALEQLVRHAGTTAHVRWHGHVDAAAYRRFLLALDLGIQLRSAALLTLSGAVADLAAFGLPSVATRAMADDMGLPGFIRTVPDDFSPLLVAEALEAALQDGADREEQRREYLRTHSVRAYGAQLLRELGLAQA